MPFVENGTGSGTVTLNSGASAHPQSVLQGYDDDMVALSDQAIDWLVRLQSDEVTEHDRQAFVDWSGQSDAHMRAARDAQALFGAVSQTETAQDWTGQEAALSPNAKMPINIARNTRRRMPGSMARFGARRFALSIVSLCALVLVVVAGAGIQTDIWTRWNAQYSTDIGVFKTVNLPDGTVAHMNTASAFSIDFSNGVRRVDLVAGEVIFDVAKDAQHPFIVSARGGEAMAVGTVYGVRITDDHVNVTVREGVVEVSTGVGSSMRLLAGDQAVYHDGRGPQTGGHVDLAAYGSWERGKLIFNNRPLGDVIDEVQRYKTERIVIARDAVHDLKVTGVFEIAELDDLLDTLEQTMNARVVRLPLLTVIY